MAREKCGLLEGPRSVPVSCEVIYTVIYSRLIPECAVSHVRSVLAIHVSCIVLGTLRKTMTCVRVFL